MVYDLLKYQISFNKDVFKCIFHLVKKPETTLNRRSYPIWRPDYRLHTKIRMKLQYLVFLATLTVLFYSCAPKSRMTNHASSGAVLLRADLKHYFDSCNVAGSVVIFDNNKQQWILSDTVDSKTETLPASTFKIINLLIALETKTISDENDIIKWTGSTDTVKYGYRPEIYRDMTIKEAFELSTVWVFEELAKKIGRENYEKYLKSSHYGNQNLSQKDTDFWNFGAFAISPVNQVEFIKNLYDGKLPFSRSNIDIVKRVMITMQHEDYTIRAKTGWTSEDNISIGWWVGYVENRKGVFFFATRLLQDKKLSRPGFASCRKDITKSVLKDLGILD